MDVNKVLTCFENLAATVSQMNDVTIPHKLFWVLDNYSFPQLTPNEDWRLKQIRSTVEQQIALLENTCSRH